MIVHSLIFIPALAAAMVFVLRNVTLSRWLLIACAIIHSILTALCWRSFAPVPPDAHFALDAAGLLVLSITSAIFLAISSYCLGWLPREYQAGIVIAKDEKHPANQPEYVFVGCCLLFLAAMTTVACSQHMGILWVAIEATTLSSAPLIYFHHHHRSLEAAWKYLLICSVGIAIALLGNYFLIISSASSHSSDAPMLLSALIGHASTLDIPWLKAAIIFLVVGYGTKAGLAPLHTWLPDAHSQAPSPVSALLSGSLLNCAFLGLYRALQICSAAGLEQFAQTLFIIFGLMSLGWAAIFIVRQSDFKRLLAYSSVENMGIITLGAGLGKAGLTGCFLHAINHSLTKAMLFLVAGNLLHAFGTKRIIAVRGARHVVPISAALWFAGFLAISGIPPFGTFISKFSIVKAALDGGNYIVAGMFLLFIVVVFMGFAQVFIPMYFGNSSSPNIRHGSSNEVQAAKEHVSLEPWGSIWPPLVLCILVLILGLYIPAFLSETIARAAGDAS